MAVKGYSQEEIKELTRLAKEPPGPNRKEMMKSFLATHPERVDRNVVVRISEIRRELRDKGLLSFPPPAGGKKGKKKYKAKEKKPLSAAQKAWYARLRSGKVKRKSKRFHEPIVDIPVNEPEVQVNRRELRFKFKSIRIQDGEFIVII